MLPLAHMAYGSNAKMLFFRQLTGQLLSKSSEKNNQDGFRETTGFFKKFDQTKGAGAVIKEETASGVYAIYSTTTPRMLGSKALHWC
jgi:hypothetical protein